MSNKIDSVKSHFRRNKNIYAAATVGVATGALVCFVAIKRPTEILVNPKVQQILSWKPQATIEVHIEALGDPGNIVQDITTGTIYASQGQAARELGLNAARISEQLRGRIPNVGGHVFEKLGKAAVSQ